MAEVRIRTKAAMGNWCVPDMRTLGDAPNSNNRDGRRPVPRTSFGDDGFAFPLLRCRTLSGPSQPSLQATRQRQITDGFNLAGRCMLFTAMTRQCPNLPG